VAWTASLLENSEDTFIQTEVTNQICERRSDCSPLQKLPGFLVMHRADGAEAFRRLFGGEVALGFGEQFVADHELPDRGRAEKWRVEMGVKLPVIV